MIKRFHALYVGQIELDNIGLDGTPANERRYSNERFSEVFWSARDVARVMDELGYYAALGATMGDGSGAEFFLEGTWRKATAEVELDPEDLEDVDDIEVEDHADLDLDGLGVNLGVRWTF